MKSAQIKLPAAALTLAVSVVTLCCSVLQAAPKPLPPLAENQPTYGEEPWPAQRVVVLLPLLLGEQWNVDRVRTVPLLPDAEARAQLALQRTGKFSTTQVHRYNPLVLRAVQEKLITKEEADALIAAPTLAGLQGVLGKMQFEQAPLIAQISLDKIARTSGPASNLTATATGRLYEASSAQPIREAVVTSREYPLYNRQKQKGKQVLVQRNPSERLLSAAEGAFDLLARDFVRPIPSIILPEPVITTPVMGTVVVPAGTPPAEQLMGTFPVPK